MTLRLTEAKKMIEQCSTDEQVDLKAHISNLVPHPLEVDWGIDADTIQGAIRRSSDLTKRGVRGIIAEAVFESSVVPSLAGSGWEIVEVPSDLSYDAMLRRSSRSVRIQIKLQRLEKKVPKLYYPKHYAEGSLYVVEVQKTRSGETKVKTALQGSDSELEEVTAVTQKTRPYRFGDFDILAVNLHPSSGDWKNFRYTVASWLLAKPAEAKLIETFQPVAAIANDVWTNDLLTCLNWLESGATRSILTDILHTKQPKKAKAIKTKTKSNVKTKGK